MVNLFGTTPVCDSGFTVNGRSRVDIGKSKLCRHIHQKGRFILYPNRSVLMGKVMPKRDGRRSLNRNSYKGEA